MVKISLRRTTIFCAGSVWLLTIVYLFLSTLNRKQPNSNHIQLLPNQLGHGVDEEIQISPQFKKPDRVVQKNARLDQYCNQFSDSNSLGREGKIADSMRLKSVFVFFRHGDRAPIYERYADPLHIPCDLHRHAADQLVLSFIQHVSKFRPSKQPSLKQFAHYPQESVCAPSSLTPLGVIQHLRLGRHLHLAYGNKLVSTSTNERLSLDDIFLATTPYSRTYQSAVALLYGFLGDALSLDNLRPAISHANSFCSVATAVFPRSQEPCTCMLLNVLFVQDFHEGNGRLLYHKVLNYRDEIHSVLNITPSEPFNIGGLLDRFMPAVCHDMSLPCSQGKCITTEHLLHLWRAVDETFVARLKSQETYSAFSSLFSHPILSFIALKIEQMIDTETAGLTYNAPRMHLFSGHDNTVSPIAVSLGIDGGSWPPYASRLVLELIHDVRNDTMEGGYFIRALYNGLEVTSQLAFCQEYLHNGYCPFIRFKRFIRVGMLERFNAPTFAMACAGGSPVLKKVS